MPTVSIVLPTYNGEKYIRESINSILNQTFCDWELIIVNDCSTDSTSEIIEEYSRRESRIRVLNNEENLQLPKALNKGFSFSKGRYLTWTSDDNLYLPDALNIMFDYLEADRDCYMVCTDINIINGVGDTIESYAPFMPFDENDIYFRNCVYACFMYRREVMEQIGEYDARRVYMEDYDYWLRILKRYGRIGYINQSLYRYRLHEGALTATKREEIHRQSVRLRTDNLDWLLSKFFGEKNYICRIYYEFMELNNLDNNAREKIEKIMPELTGDCMEDDDSPIVIFGAGEYGRKAYEYLNKDIAFFADSNPSKVGQKVCGITVISINEMVKMSKDFRIVIAVGSGKVYELMKVLFENKVLRYSTYQKLIWLNNCMLKSE